MSAKYLNKKNYSIPDKEIIFLSLNIGLQLFQGPAKKV